MRNRGLYGPYFDGGLPGRCSGKRDHSGIPHGGFVLRSGSTGWEQEHRHLIEYSLKLDSRGPAAAEDHHVQPVRPPGRFVHMADLRRLCEDFYLPRIPPCEHCLQFHIRILADGAFHAPSQIAVT